MNMLQMLLALIALSVFSVQGQTPKYDKQHPPRFEAFPVAEKWNKSPASLKLTSRSERMFRLRLANAAKEPPNFAGRYRFTTWGCGSECISGAIVDLATGEVFSPPLPKGGSSWMHFSVCQSAYENSGVEFQVESRLLILRCGLNYSERLEKNIPDTYYFVWEENRFRQILYISGKQPER